MSHNRYRGNVTYTLPTRKQKVLEQAEKILTEVLGQDDPMAAKLRKRLKNDTALTSLLK
jgi:hypothetical protein